MTKIATIPQMRQLEALNKAGRKGLTPTMFSRKAWPHAKGHHRITTPRPGQEVKGAVMAISAGGALGRLVVHRWVERIANSIDNRYRITAYGRRVLRESKKAQGWTNEDGP